jgi:dTDP-glucose pyrophosphorylase
MSVDTVNEVKEETKSEYELDELVKIYLTIRKEREMLSQQFELKDAELKAEMGAIEQVMLAQCNSINAESIKTGNGTIIKSLRENFVCGDWENFKKFVLENQAVELLQQRIHQTNFKEFLSQHEGDGLPPGINVLREFTITVRKPSTK